MANAKDQVTTKTISFKIKNNIEQNVALVRDFNAACAHHTTRIRELNNKGAYEKELYEELMAKPANRTVRFLKTALSSLSSIGAARSPSGSSKSKEKRDYIVGLIDSEQLPVYPLYYNSDSISKLEQDAMTQAIERNRNYEANLKSYDKLKNKKIKTDEDEAEIRKMSKDIKFTVPSFESSRVYPRFNPPGLVELPNYRLLVGDKSLHLSITSIGKAKAKASIISELYASSQLKDFELTSLLELRSDPSSDSLDQHYLARFENSAYANASTYVKSQWFTYSDHITNLKIIGRLCGARIRVSANNNKGFSAFCDITVELFNIGGALDAPILRASKANKAYTCLDNLAGGSEIHNVMSVDLGIRNPFSAAVHSVRQSTTNLENEGYTRTKFDNVYYKHERSFIDQEFKISGKEYKRFKSELKNIRVLKEKISGFNQMLSEESDDSIHKKREKELASEINVFLKDKIGLFGLSYQTIIYLREKRGLVHKWNAHSRYEGERTRCRTEKLFSTDENYDREYTEDAKLLRVSNSIKNDLIDKLCNNIVAAALGYAYSPSDKRYIKRYAKCGYLLLEDLSKYNPSKRNSKLENKILSVWGKGVLLNKLQFKCKFYGIILGVVNPAYTSQVSSKNLSVGFRVSDKKGRPCITSGGPLFMYANENHTMSKINADLNAAANLFNRIFREPFYISSYKVKNKDSYIPNYYDPSSRVGQLIKSKVGEGYVASLMDETGYKSLVGASVLTKAKGPVFFRTNGLVWLKRADAERAVYNLFKKSIDFAKV